ncbi:MAG: segregation and condensation protein [Eubacteriaceae bacterium]|jgi:segregation and condensation protein B|nr:segregation and condensation protein [Eubacteriaceae bacterium]MDK2904723.1 segregation and condensation protein [Eubacteriaceae bacterium]
MDSDELAGILEGILFGAGDAVSMNSLSKVLEVPTADIRFALEILKQDYRSKARGIRLVEVKDTYQLSTKPEIHEHIRQIMGQEQKNGLSRAAMETLAIIAYRQPITRQVIDEIRGVASSKALQRLLDQQLICECGRLEAPGRPFLYKTSNEFLKAMGFKDLKEMPDYETFSEGQQQVFNLEDTDDPKADVEMTSNEVSDSVDDGKQTGIQIQDQEDTL